jgi:hypothetical protein
MYLNQERKLIDDRHIFLRGLSFMLKIAETGRNRLGVKRGNVVCLTLTRCSSIYTEPHPVVRHEALACQNVI